LVIGVLVGARRRVVERLERCPSCGRRTHSRTPRAPASRTRSPTVRCCNSRGEPRGCPLTLAPVPSSRAVSVPPSNG
jgi:hypothetical protein